MDTTNGRIHTQEEIETIRQTLIANGLPLTPSRFKEMTLPATPRQMARKPPRIGRNEPCPCGSGKKFKKCCLRDPNDVRFTE